MKRIARLALSTAVIAGVLASGSAQAALTSFQTYTGNYGVSTDGWGATSQSGSIDATVPFGATVTAAYLYTSTYGWNGGVGGSIAGNPVSFTALGATNWGGEAGRADVTSIIKPLIDGGVGGTYSFGITETQSVQDGAALVVVYQLASLATSTVGILDGFSLTTGDSTAINFANPLNPAAPGFFAEMRLGIGFSCCGQQSTVKVNGTTITTTAGNNDDGVGGISNGQLITVGGDDDPFSTLLPSYENDHERYNLVPYITNGDTSINVYTQNPSNNDNIFLAVFHASGVAAVNEPPPSVPEPMTLSLLGLGLLGLASQRKRMS